MLSSVPEVISENLVTWSPKPWVIRFHTDQPGNGLELLCSSEDSSADKRAAFANSPVIARLFAFGRSTVSGELQLPLLDIDGKDGQIRCRYGSTESFPAELTLSIKVSTIALDEDGVAGKSVERIGIPFVICETNFAIQTEHEVVPRLSVIHNISRVAHKENCEIVVTPEDFMQKSVLSGIAFPAVQEKTVEGIATLNLLRYSLAGLEWSLIPYCHPAGIERIAPALFQDQNIENCQEVWAVFTFPERLEKGVTAVVRAGVLLSHPSVGAGEVSEIVRECLVGFSPLREG